MEGEMSEEIQHVEAETKLVPYQAPQSPSLFGTADPVEVIDKAARVADALKKVIVANGLVSKISGKEYPRCEAWTLLGTMLGVFPVTVWTRPIEGGWEARTEARTLSGVVVGAAEAMCLRSERNWRDRDEFALRSMAATRSVAKALRMPLGFVMSLSGYEPTPAEEMTFDHPQKPAKPAPAKPAVKATPKTRAWFLDKLRESFDEPTLLSYAIARGYLDGEGLESWALDKVLLKRTEIAKLQTDILEFVKSGKVKGKPKAKGKTLPTSPQGQLATLCTAAGFSFDEFHAWAITHDHLEPDKFTSFDDLPTDAAEFFVEGFKGILKQLQAARGQNEPPTP
jgi:hypothetical protein